jgi:hypothetical protein
MINIFFGRDTNQKILQFTIHSLILTFFGDKFRSRETEGNERAEPGQLKQFVPSPTFTHANKVSLLNKQLSIMESDP